MPNNNTTIIQKTKTKITNVGKNIKVTKKKVNVSYSSKYGFYYGTCFDLDNSYC